VACFFPGTKEMIHRRGPCQANVVKEFADRKIATSPLLSIPANV